MSEVVRIAEKFRGGMVGTGLGDAIGELAFAFPHRELLLLAAEQSDTLVYTDDTAMAMGLAESIVELGGLDQEHLGDTLRLAFHREPWRGYALGPPTVFSRVEHEGATYAEAAAMLYGGEGSFGNGAAMRAAPVGLFFYDAPDLYRKARLSATVTHAHPVGVDGAAVQAQAVAQAVSLNPERPFAAEDFMRTLLDTAQTREIRSKLLIVLDALCEGVPARQAAKRLGQGVAVHESLPFALYAFLRHPKDFHECLLCAVLNGGDRDTLGAIACAISGSYLGLEAIPEMWRERLENREIIEWLGLRLAEERPT